MSKTTQSDKDSTIAVLQRLSIATSLPPAQIRQLPGPDPDVSGLSSRSLFTYPPVDLSSSVQK